MAKYLLLALNGPKSGVALDVYNAWYDRQVRKIAAMPGVVSGRRYKVLTAPGLHPYLAAYQIDVDDIALFLREMDARLQPLDPPFDRATSSSILAIEMD